MNDLYWMTFYASVVAMRMHPRDCEDIFAVDLDKCGFVADDMLAVMMQRLEFRSDVMATNKFSALVRMLEVRIARQEQALVESKLQLEAAQASQRAEDAGQVQLPLVVKQK